MDSPAKFEEYSHVILERTYDIFLEKYLEAYPDLPYLRVAVFASNLSETIGEGVYYYLTRAEEVTAKVAAEAPEGTHPETLAIEAMRQCVLEALDYLGRLVQGEFATLKRKTLVDGYSRSGVFRQVATRHLTGASGAGVRVCFVSTADLPDDAFARPGSRTPRPAYSPILLPHLKGIHHGDMAFIASATSPPAERGPLSSLGRFVIAGVAGAYTAFHGKLSNTFTMPGTQTQQLSDELAQRFLSANRGSGQIILTTGDGTALTEEQKQAFSHRAEQAHRRGFLPWMRSPTRSLPPPSLPRQKPSSTRRTPRLTPPRPN